MPAFNRLAWIPPTAVIAGLLLSLVASVGAAEPPRKILKKEERIPESGNRLFQTYEYYLDADGKEVKHGLVTFFDPNGIKSHEITHVDGSTHGPSIRYNRAGAVIMRGQYAKGRYDGKFEWFYDNGKTQSVQHWDRGFKVGTVPFWSDQGVLQWEEEFDRGRKMKKSTFHENGAKESTGTFAPVADPEDYETVKSGTWSYWRPDGTMVAEGVWKEGKPFSGICETGLDDWARFAEGKLVEHVKIHPAAKPAK